MSPIIIIGAGGHGVSVAEIIQITNDFNIIGFLDNSHNNHETIGIKNLGPIDNIQHYLSSDLNVFIAIGNNKIRKLIHEKIKPYDVTFPTIAHPTSVISKYAKLGEGCAIMANTYIGARTQVGAFCIINPGATVDHDCDLHDYSHLGINSSMAGGAKLEEGSWLQPGAALSYNCSISENIKVAPSAVVTTYIE